MGPRVERIEPQARPLPFARFGWAVLNLVQLLYALAWTAGWITVALLALVLTGNRRWPLRMAARCWAPGLLWGAAAELEIVGGERIDWSRPHVFVANHQSMIDVCALFRAVPVPLRFVLKRELARVPFLGWYARAMGMVFVERCGGRTTTDRLQRAAELVRSGSSLCAFPEGTRSRDGAVARFKGGVFRVAMEAGATVVPVAIQGSGAVLPAAGFQVRPGRIRVCFGEPVSPAGLPAAGRKELAGHCRKAIVEQLHGMRASR